MIQDSQLLIVSGTGRNVGKTEFICRLVNTFCGERDIYCLKVSAIFPDEELYHGDHSNTGPARTVFLETRKDTEKDTSRMLRAGATEVYYMQGDSSSISRDFHHFKTLLPPKSIIVCESNSLADMIRPAVHVVITATDKQPKPRARRLLETADLLIQSDGRSGFPGIERIIIDPSGCWQLAQLQ